MVKILPIEKQYMYNKGLVISQASQIKLTKRLLTEVLEKILKEDVGVNVLHEIINRYRDIILKKKISHVDDITIIKKVGKMPEEYKSLPAHVELALKRKALGERFYTSEKISFIVLSNNPLKIIHVSDYNGKYDTNYYWNKQVFAPTYRLLSIIYPKENWDIYLDTDITQTKLNLFIK